MYLRLAGDDRIPERLTPLVGGCSLADPTRTRMSRARSPSLESRSHLPLKGSGDTSMSPARGIAECPTERLEEGVPRTRSLALVLTALASSGRLERMLACLARRM